MRIEQNALLAVLDRGHREVVLDHRGRVRRAPLSSPAARLHRPPSRLRGRAAPGGAPSRPRARGGAPRAERPRAPPGASGDAERQDAQATDDLGFLLSLVAVGADGRRIYTRHQQKNRVLPGRETDVGDRGRGARERALQDQGADPGGGCRRERVRPRSKRLCWSEGEFIALCRCGGSSTKPFCDGTHKRNGFDATERVADGGWRRAPGGPSAA